MNWEISWSFSIGQIDFETTAVMNAVTATDAVTKFIQLMATEFPEYNWEKQIFRAEKNYTCFLFILEKGKLRRLDPAENI